MATVVIQHGKLQGKKSQNTNGFEYNEFLGIPYAKQPVGQLRFKSPQPPDKWAGVRDATVVNPNNVGLQFDMFSSQIIGSEDCLYLNVYTPKIPDGESKLLPVMVFIHGGGFVVGNGILENEHGPNFLIEHNVVIVTINYRLSVLGFLCLDIPEAAGNMGLKDQVKALEWVQNNIVHFSGDKDNVTIFGISAGAASVEYHLLSPKSKGLFHKAILHSGSCLNHWAVNYEPKKLAYQLATKLGYNNSSEDVYALKEFLLNIPGTDLIAASSQICENYTTEKARIFFGFVPTVEKDFSNGDAFLRDLPYRLLKQGLFYHVPIIKGFCNREGYLTYVLKPKAILDVQENKNFTSYWSFELDSDDKIKYREEMKEAYSMNIKPGDDEDKVGVDFFSDFDFVSGIWTSGKLIARKGVPVRFYDFSYEGKINFFKVAFGIKRTGTAHGDDHTYILYNKVAKEAQGHDLIIRNTMCLMWTNFAKSSCPTPPDSMGELIEWPVYTEDNPVYLRIDKNIEVLSDYEPNRMSIYEEIYEKYEK
ncbi:esterase E4 [Papilio machaon]|uniref:esterase E4 n=1 Tax=Papilio machaon TaxID=76193 RepID=UPI001E6653DD|nr:esterase E4 [Papilio machaon]